MTTLFIADVHLNEDQPAITAGFLNFLQTEAIQAKALYILGDLFDVWIGDDDPNPLHKDVANALKVLEQHHVPCYFIHGNRDFLLAQGFAQSSHMKLLPQEKVIELNGHKILILHGDILCTDDVNYQRFRRYVHNRFLQRLFLWLPLSFRLKVASKLRSESQRSNQKKTSDIMDVNQHTVIKTLQAHKVRMMVHGHTHKPAIHSFEINGKTVQRIVLGAWHEKGSVLKISADNKPELVELKLP